VILDLPAALAAMLAWGYLAFGRARLTGESEFDRIDTQGVPERWPPVSVIIPARNEAEMIRFTLPSVLSFYYPQVEVILVDDCSGDGTAEAAQQIAAAQGSLRVLRGTPPPEGWRGKIWALEQGVRAGGGEWLLFLDADILCTPNLLRDLVRLALNRNYNMASLMALLRVEGFWDRLLIPAFFFFFHVLYPFHLVRKGKSAVAAAAGGCILVERRALDRAGGLEAVKGAWIDDLALARALKRSGAGIYLGATAQAASFRRYGTLQSIREMVTRSAFTQLRHSWALVLGTVTAMGILFGAPLAGVFRASVNWAEADPPASISVLGAVCCCALACMIAAYAPALRLYQLPVLWALTLPAAAALYAAMTVESAFLHTFGQGPRWKGRAGWS
jgi:hopene-associated glycosyltransferase HpnB